MLLSEKIKHYRKRAGWTQEELGKRLGVKLAAVSKWECGLVENIPASRLRAMADLFGIPASSLIDDHSDALPGNIIPLPAMKTVPLLGAIACGEPILASENLEGNVAMPENVHADFALRCKGDSMINARIYNGDIVYIRQQDAVQDGEIAAVLIGDEATLKRVRIYTDHVVLEPENPQFRPMSYWGEDAAAIRILGKAVAFTSSVR